MLNAPVSQVALYCTCIEALVGQVKPAGVTEHMRVDAERKSGQLPCPCDNLSNSAGRNLKSLVVEKYMLTSLICVLDNLQSADDVFL